MFKESTALNLVTNLIAYMMNAKKDYADAITRRIAWQSRLKELEAMLEED